MATVVGEAAARCEIDVLTLAVKAGVTGGERKTARPELGLDELVVVLVAVGRRAHAHLDALELVVEDEVHHACDRVRPVHSRSTAGEDVDALHHERRNDADVGRFCGAGRQALAIDQGQGTTRTKTAKVNGRVTQCTVVVKGIERWRHLRILVDQILCAGNAGVLEFFLLDLRHRRRCSDRLALNTGTGHDDRVEILGLFGGGGRRLRGCGALGKRNARARKGRRAYGEREHNRVAELGGLQSHLFSLQVQIVAGFPNGNLFGSVDTDAKTVKADES